jgi:hypothetical protein
VGCAWFGMELEVEDGLCFTRRKDCDNEDLRK